mmetsp:Transcript_40044/g.115422  ORF Transcript_40044/g.115422 Transcript_40044/m.115422 type:complete len:285 (+) Transcript_40044:1121-1975(+)
MPPTQMFRKLTPSPRPPEGSPGPETANKGRCPSRTAAYWCTRCQGVSWSCSMTHLARPAKGLRMSARRASSASSSSTAFFRVLSKVDSPLIPMTCKRRMPRSMASKTHTSSGKLALPPESCSSGVSESLHSLRITGASRAAHHFCTSSAVLSSRDWAVSPDCSPLRHASRTIRRTQRRRRIPDWREEGAQTSTSGSVCPTTHVHCMRRTKSRSWCPQADRNRRKSVSAFGSCLKSGALTREDSITASPFPGRKRTCCSNTPGRVCEPGSRKGLAPLNGPSLGPE